MRTPRTIQKTAGGSSDTFRWFRPMLFWTRGLAPAHSAVIGCQPPTQWTVVDVREPEWTSMDVPPTVLKTAGLASAVVHQRPLKFDC